MPELTSWFLDAAEAEAGATIRAGTERKRPGSSIDEVPLLLGKVFEVARRRRGLSRDEVSLRTHLERKDVECLERGVLHVTWAARIQQLSSVLDLPEKEVFCLTQPGVLRDREVGKVAKHFYRCTRLQDSSSSARDENALLDALLEVVGVYCSRQAAESPDGP